jgi:hypothetical protein
VTSETDGIRASLRTLICRGRARHFPNHRGFP